MTLCPSTRCAFLLLAAVVSAGAAARPAFADERGERIDRIFAAYDRPDSPGCAVAVLHRGQVIHQRGYGRAHLEWDAPGNRQAKGAHIGEQNGPTGVQGYTGPSDLR